MSGQFGNVPELQSWFQKAPGYIHLKGKADRMMSVVIPLGLTVVGGIVLTRGLYSMYTGTNKLE